MSPKSENGDNQPMEYPLYQVDAFTQRTFGGNPAAVMPLPHWLDDRTLQAIAAENNLAETAYFVPAKDGYRLRWFTPAAEVDLCGHATLASAWVLFHLLGYDQEVIRFQTLSGELRVSRVGDRISMDFPALHSRAVPVPKGLIKAVGPKPVEIFEGRDMVFVYEDAEQVKALKPDMAAIERDVAFGLIVTAPGPKGEPGCDFVSRFFAPAKGIPEDPVTGSAHCTLAPYWAKRLGKTSFFARQVSARGGELWCSLEGDRVRLEGHGVLVLQGAMLLP